MGLTPMVRPFYHPVVRLLVSSAPLGVLKVLNNFRFRMQWSALKLLSPNTRHDSSQTLLRCTFAMEANLMSNFAKRAITTTSLLLAIFALATAAKINAQAVSIASITGRVTDQSGAVVGGAQVKITALATNTVYSAVSGSDGLYSFPSLPIGAYTLEVTAAGFSTYDQTGIRLQVNDAPEVNVSLKVGAVSDKVEVEADISMVQTQQNSISQVVDQARIVELPLNGRDPSQLITISGAAID